MPATSFVTHASLCPFHDGAETLDNLLAEIAVNEEELLDACLDLRSLVAEGRDADACVAQMLRVRHLLGERHYLAFYRVRCWLRRVIVIQVRRQRGEPWQTYSLPLDCAHGDEIVNGCLARLSEGGEFPSAVQVRFAFASGEAAPARREEAGLNVAFSSHEIEC